MTSNPYYADLSRELDPARRVGWRHPIEQAYRFEVALDAVTRPCDAPKGERWVLDIGSGLGALREFLAVRAPDVGWVGLEREAEFLRDCPHGPVVVGDYRNPPSLPEFNVAVAIGALSGSDAPEVEVAALFELCTRARDSFCMTVIDSELIRDRISIRADARLAAVSPARLREVARAPGWNVVVEPITTAEVAVFGWRHAELALRTNAERVQETLRGPGAADATGARRAWLALEVGLPEMARELLEWDGRDAELASIVAQRLDVA